MTVPQTPGSLLSSMELVCSVLGSRFGKHVEYCGAAERRKTRFNMQSRVESKPAAGLNAWANVMKGAFLS